MSDRRPGPPGIMHFGLPPRFRRNVRVAIDIAPEAIGEDVSAHARATVVSWQWFYPKDTPRRGAIVEKASKTPKRSRPDDCRSAPTNCDRALHDIRT
ncbi:MAG: hypothetical protein J2P47_05865 [Acetobacteraceae bacterium]|nr:hypothetical protein [Acetobacteraceae bacterium]